MENSKNINALLRRVPKMDLIIAAGEYRELEKQYSVPEARYFARMVLDELRAAIKDGKAGLAEDSPEAGVIAALRRRLEWHHHRRKQHVINATGVIMHTGLGRAFLPREVREVLSDCGGYCNVEVDLHSGDRNFREEYLADLLCILTGAGAATIVNNCAAASLLIINTFAEGKDVIISRGELVEIGGSFRVPDVMAKSQAKMIEVGTTNKTHLKDYESAITENTGLLLKVHTSNFSIEGFARSVEREQLAALGKKYRIPVAEDLGSGALFDPAGFGLQGEPLVVDSLRAGLDAICFSGDKLCGSAQAGIILGNKDVVWNLRDNNMFRALRVDKLILAAMEASIRRYLRADDPARAMAVGEMMAVAVGDLETRARCIADAVSAGSKHCHVEVIPTTAQPGSGALPMQEMPSRGLAITSDKYSEDQLAAELRQQQPPVFCRIQEDRVIMDMRTIQAAEDPLVIIALLNL
ncbi:L-seryl-tRNA(Sec) selenium transferase [Planctomycetota bacterium]